MLTLTLLRHAKSAWDDADLDDHQRPLSRRGTRDAPRIGRWLARWSADHACPPDHILCSDAVRTRATLALLLPELVRRTAHIEAGAPPSITFDAGLYLAAPPAILARIAKAPRTARHVLVIGHNPGLHMLALALAGAGEADAIAALARKFPTAAAAVFACDTADFEAIDPLSTRLQAFMTPKRL